jgi:hypothetical protein
VTYYVPLSCLESLIEAKTAFERLEGKEIPMKIVSITPNEPALEIVKGYKVFAFPTSHRVPSQGYAIVHCQPGALLPQYLGYTQQQLGQLRQQHISIHGAVRETVEVVYTGDTVFSALLSPDLSFIFSAEILLLEMTYLDGDRAKAIKHCHLHLDDFLDHAALFQNQQVVFMHLSSRYGSGSRVLDLLRRRLPYELLERCAVGLKCFGFNQSVTRLVRSDDSRHSARGGEGERRGGSTKKGGGESRVGGGQGRGAEAEDIEGVLLSDRCLPCELPAPTGTPPTVPWRPQRTATEPLAETGERAASQKKKKKRKSTP